VWPKLPQDRYIDAGAVTTRYWEQGDGGSAVIFLHGFGLSAEIWMHNVNAVAQRHHAYVPDLVGFGKSDKPDVAYSIPYMARFVDDFMRATGIKKANLVGLSLGGGIALRFAMDYPEKVANLILVDSAGFGNEVIFGLRLLSLPIIGEVLTVPSRAGTYFFFRDAVYDRRLLTHEFIDIYYRLHSLPGTRKARLRILRAIVNIHGGRERIFTPTLTDLHRIRHRTMVIWGKQDRVLPLTHAYVAKEHIADSRLHLFDRCGHMPNFEHPEEFNRVVLEFLDES